MPPPSAPRPGPPRPRWRSWLAGLPTAAALVVVVAFHGWTVHTSGGFAPAGEDDLYHLLVRGYRLGQLHLDRAPEPALLALADPYDPAQNGPHRLPDATYYHGRYYLYFGVTPALILMLPVALLTGHDLSTGAAVFVFAVAGFLAASAWWLALRRRYFPDSARWTGATGVLVLGFATHLLALLRRPMVWELPIAAGFAFTMAALLAATAALHGRRPVLAFTLAGVCLGLAMAARPPLLFGAALLAAPAWLLIRRAPRPLACCGQLGLAAAAGIVACGLGMLAHNHARFGSVLEFGQNFQLTGARELASRRFGLDYLPHNFGVYYFHPPRWSWEFPFLSASTPGWSLPDYAGSEEMCGLFVTFPFLALALAAPLAAWRRPAGEAGPLRALLGAVAGLYVGVGGFLLAFFATTERYLAEFAPALALLALIGWLAVERRIRPAPARAAWLAAGTLAALATVPVGALLSLNYHGNSLQRDNPPVWAGLAESSHRTLSEIGLRLGRFDGPRVLKVRFAPQPHGTLEPFWQSADPALNERLLVEHLGERTLRFGHARADLPGVTWGEPVTWSPAHSHTVEVQLPSLHGPATGWMSGLRRGVEFRERSAVTLWFSGARTLGAVTPPLPARFLPGGAVATGFSGVVRREDRRLFRADEIGPEPAVTAAGAGPPPAAGGVLQLRLRFPDAILPPGEPLFVAGDLYGSDIVFVREDAGGAVQFAFEHYGTPVRVGAPLHLDRRQEHTITLALPSFAAGAVGTAATGAVVIRVNGREALRTPATARGFSAESIRIGRNPFGTTCGPEFRGWLLEAGWKPPF